MIEKIKGTNFRCYEAVEIGPLSAGMNIIAGLNGTGKSTILDMISAAFTGTCRGSETGRAAGDLRRVGSKRKWGVELKTPGGLLTRVEGQGPQSAVQKTVEASMGMSGDQMRACLYSGEIVGMIVRRERKAVQQLVLDLGGSNKVELEELVRKAVNQHLPPHKIKEAVTLTEIRQLHKAAFDARKNWKKVVGGLGELTPPAKPKLSRDVVKPGELADRVDAKVAELEAEMERLVREGVKANEKARERAGAEERLGLLKGRAEKLKSKIAETGTAKEIADETKALLKKIEHVEGVRSEVGPKLEKLRGEIAALEAQRGQAVEWGRKQTCPTCKQKVGKAMKDRLRASAEQLGRDLQRLIIDRDAAQESLDGVEDLEDLNRKMAALAGREETYTRLHNEETELKKEIRTLDKRLKQKALEAPDHGDAIIALRERIKEGQGRSKMLRDYLRDLQAYETEKRKRANAEGKVEALEMLVTELGPEGIQRELAEGKETAGFLDAVSESLAELGFTVDWSPLMSLTDDPLVNDIPARLLSSSQLHRLGICFQIAVADALKFPLVCVDDWDRFDTHSRGTCQDILNRSGLQVLIFGTFKGTMKGYIAQAEAINGDATAGGSRMFLVEEGAVTAPGLQVAA